MTSVDRMHVLYEMHPMFAPCPFASCTFLLVFHATNAWEPGSREHPTISSMFRTSARLLLHRYLHELPGPECCRGTIFVSPPWHPFCSAMVTKCFITCSCQHFHKNCIKLVYVIRIMITTFKMFKLVVALNC